MPYPVHRPAICVTRHAENYNSFPALGPCWQVKITNPTAMGQLWLVPISAVAQSVANRKRTGPHVRTWTAVMFLATRREPERRLRRGYFAALRRIPSSLLFFVGATNPRVKLPNTWLTATFVDESAANAAHVRVPFGCSVAALFHWHNRPEILRDPKSPNAFSLFRTKIFLLLQREIGSSGQSIFVALIYLNRP